LLIAVLLVTVCVSCVQDVVVTLTFDANGGTGEMQPQQMHSTKQAVIDENKFTRVNYLFSGWNTNADGTGTHYDDRQLIQIKSDLTLYAQWHLRDDIVFLQSDTKKWENGKMYSLNEDVTISGRVNVNGTVFLILVDGYTLTCPEGISIPEGNCLMIFAPGEGSGKLVAKGKWAQPGIGCTFHDEYEKYKMGTLIIYGGDIEAEGGETAAGIGGSRNGSGGTVRIFGGKIKATGGDWGAGIGGGKDKSGCNLYVFGGDIETYGGSDSYGIGLGGGNTAGLAQLYVYGGNLYAKGGMDFYGQLCCALCTGTTLYEGVKMEQSPNNKDWHPYEPDPKYWRSEPYIRSYK